MTSWREDACVFIGVFLLCFAFLASSVNVFDFFAYYDYMQKSVNFDFFGAAQNAFGVWGGGAGGFSRSSFYVLLSYPFAFALESLGLDVAFSLNMFSAIMIAVSAVFVRRSVSLLFDSKLANFSTLVYIILPWVLFNGINATLSSMQLAVTSAWLYLVLKYRTKKEPSYAYAASGLLVLDVLTHLISLPLALPHMYVLLKGKRKPVFMLKNLLILSPAGLAFVYFNFFNRAYSASFSLNKFVFSSLLVSWEFVNALSFPVFALSLFSLAAFLLGKYKKSLFHDIFLLAFIATIPTMLIFHYVPMANFNSIFVFIPLLVAHVFRNAKKPLVVGLVVIGLILLKTVPMAYDFHYYPHPHTEYVKWLGSVIGDNYVLVGHECAAARVYIPGRAVCIGEENNMTPDKKVFLTSQYVENENQLELGYAAKLLKISSANLGIGKPSFLDAKNYTFYASFTGNIRPVEDHYEWLYSVYPNPLYNLFFYSALPTPRYDLYVLNQ
ncbi:MAG: hypothetical protein V1836_00380 [Candidatus Aenigmatarchaeota archaeon]